MLLDEQIASSKRDILSKINGTKNRSNVSPKIPGGAVPKDRENHKANFYNDAKISLIHSDTPPSSRNSNLKQRILTNSKHTTSMHDDREISVSDFFDPDDSGIVHIYENPNDESWRSLSHCAKDKATSTETNKKKIRYVDAVNKNKNREDYRNEKSGDPAPAIEKTCVIITKKESPNDAKELNNGTEDQSCSASVRSGSEYREMIIEDSGNDSAIEGKGDGSQNHRSQNNVLTM